MFNQETEKKINLCLKLVNLVDKQLLVSGSLGPFNEDMTENINFCHKKCLLVSWQLQQRTRIHAV